MHRRVVEFAAVCLTLGGCVVEERDDLREIDASEPQLRSQGAGEQDDDDGGIECGCWPGAANPQQGDECNYFAPAAAPVPSQQLVRENCHEVDPPWCGAQFGCEFQASVCTCTIDPRVGRPPSVLDGDPPATDYYPAGFWPGMWTCRIAPGTPLSMKKCSTVPS
ncbi:MAG: hypothetical protein IPH07_31430 [Deltaproteobacteria bacterium]|nr:hypothetical protein [Deltaproteobacteria bacterium]MBK8715428.1 hypothetical protein [Deltaproteobacteria bacterium]